MRKKEFSILKWIVFPANSVILAAIIAYFNVTVFGLRDGLPYSIIVGMIGLFSIVIVKYAESENRSLARAAFVFEIVLTAALIINACYSVSVQRKMSIARMGETSQKETIGEISKLKGSRTQREALKVVDKTQSAQSVFAGVEDILFWIMAGELVLYGLSAFTLFALAKLVDESRTESAVEEFPSSINVREQAAWALPDKSNARKKNDGNIPEEFRQDLLSVDANDDYPIYTAHHGYLRDRLRKRLKRIAFYMPKTGFKVDLSGASLNVRQFSYDGEEKTLHSVFLTYEEAEAWIEMDKADLAKAVAEKGFVTVAIPDGIVYFVRKGRTNAVKIGFTTDLEGRIKSLQTGSDKELKLAAWTEGHNGLESRLHKHFKDKRLSGEWFQLTQVDIDKVIAKIKARIASGKPL